MSQRRRELKRDSISDPFDDHYRLRAAIQSVPEPFHVYLLKPEKRIRTCWSRYCGDVQLFDSIDDAFVHGAAVLGDERFDVVPVIDHNLPTYWAVRANNPRDRVIGTEIVKEQ